MICDYKEHIFPLYDPLEKNHSYIIYIMFWKQLDLYLK